MIIIVERRLERLSTAVDDEVVRDGEHARVASALQLRPRQDARICSRPPWRPSGGAMWARRRGGGAPVVAARKKKRRVHARVNAPNAGKAGESPAASFAPGKAK